MPISTRDLAAALSPSSGQTRPREAYRTALIEQLLQPQPVRHPIQGVANMANTALVAQLVNKAQSEEDERRRGVRDTIGSALAAYRGGSGGSQQAADLFLKSDDPDLQAAGLDLAFQQPKAPTTRTRIEGDQEVVEQYDRNTGQWVKVSSGPRFKPPKSLDRLRAEEQIKAGFKNGDITNAQIANNGEIDTARQTLTELAKNLPPGTTLADELHRRMSATDPLTGLDTPDYNSYWGRVPGSSAAMRRLYPTMSAARMVVSLRCSPGSSTEQAPTRSAVRGAV